MTSTIFISVSHRIPAKLKNIDGASFSPNIGYVRGRRGDGVQSASRPHPLTQYPFYMLDHWLWLQLGSSHYDRLFSLDNASVEYACV